MKQIKGGAMSLILHDGKVLGVSRKDNHADMGLPGGKLEPGETFEEAVIRETKEETGEDIRVISEIFERVEDNFVAKTFLCEIIGDIPEVFNTTESGRVAWVTWEDLFAGSFGSYNKALFNDWSKI